MQAGKIVRSKAPLRLGLAGGGTDVSPYCDTYGGCVLNVTINMYAYCTIEETDDGQMQFYAADLGKRFSAAAGNPLEIDRDLPLHKGIYNRMLKEYPDLIKRSFRMTTYSDAPPGSGLGSSSTMVVAILKAFQEWLNLPLGEYDLALLAYRIERQDLQLSGGRQDQYAATFGGFNFMEFEKDDRVIVNPLRVKHWIQNELANSLVLFYTGTSRDSAKIIDEQIKSTAADFSENLNGLHELKKQARMMKEATLKGDFQQFADCLLRGWEAKKKTSSSITNSHINTVYDFVMRNGGRAAKISGAGGGGFMMIYCDPRQRFELVERLKQTAGTVMLAEFTDHGTEAWTIYGE